MTDRIPDQVVERLTQPIPIADHDPDPTSASPTTRRAADLGGLDDVDRQPPDIDPLEPERRGGDVGEEPLEACAGRRGQLDQSALASVSSASGYASAIAASAATGLRNS